MKATIDKWNYAALTSFSLAKEMHTQTVYTDTNLRTENICKISLTINFLSMQGNSKIQYYKPNNYKKDE